MKDEGPGRRRLPGEAKDASAPNALTKPHAGPGARTAPPVDGQGALAALPIPVTSFAADEIAAAVRSAHWPRDPSVGHGASGDGGEAAAVTCDACSAPIEGEAAGRGLYLWSRSGELSWDEPALCQDCATAITATANRKWDIEEEEG